MKNSGALSFPSFSSTCEILHNIYVCTCIGICTDK
jgi:hypothetical protein